MKKDTDTDYQLLNSQVLNRKQLLYNIIIIINIIFFLCHTVQYNGLFHVGLHDDLQ